MEYNIKNKRLAQSEINAIENEANDKIVDLILLFAKQCDGVFYGEMRFNSYKNNIVDLGNEISSIDDLIKNLGSKSEDEIKSIASQYGVDGYETLPYDSLVVEVEKKLINKTSELRSEINKVSDTYTKNNTNTYEHTMKFLADEIRYKSYFERNIELQKTYEFIESKFQSILDTLSVIHNYNDAVSNDAWKIISNKDEILDTKTAIDNNIDKCCKSINDKEKEELSVKIDDEYKYIEDLYDEIDASKENLVNVYGEGKFEMAFVSLETKILNDLYDIKSNISGDVVLTDDFILNQDLIDKYVTAFHQFFEELEFKELQVKKYLAENGIEPIVNKKVEERPLEDRLAEAVNRDMEAEKVAEEVVNNLELNDEPVKEETDEAKEEDKQETEEVKTDVPVENTTELVQEPIITEPQIEVNPVDNPVMTDMPADYKFHVLTASETSPEVLQGAKNKAKSSSSLNKIFSKIFNPSERTVSNSELLNDLQSSEGRSI